VIYSCCFTLSRAAKDLSFDNSQNIADLSVNHFQYKFDKFVLKSKLGGVSSFLSIQISSHCLNSRVSGKYLDFFTHHTITVLCGLVRLLAVLGHAIVLGADAIVLGDDIFDITGAFITFQLLLYIVPVFQDSVTTPVFGSFEKDVEEVAVIHLLAVSIGLGGNCEALT
jgi:hypothetical protein